MGSGGAAGAQSGCADGSDEQVYAGGMVGCDGETTLCDAGKLCAFGWHLCRYDEYTTRGGTDVIASAARWLASCVRDHGVAGSSCPSTDVCYQCTSDGAVPTPTTYLGLQR